MEQYRIRLADGSEFGPASMEVIEGWARERRVPPDALLVPAEGNAVRSVLAEPSLRAIIQPAVNHPPTQPQAIAPQQYSGMIPYRNKPALIAYYLGLFSLLPCLGVGFSLPALVLGIIGLRKRAQNPEIKGAAHAWIGIVMGAIFTLLWGGAILFAIVGSANGW